MPEWRLKVFDQSGKSLTTKSDLSKNNVKTFADVVEEHSYSVISINDSDLQSRENWRGKSEPTYALLNDYDSDEDYKDEPQMIIKEKVDAQNENVIHLKTRNDVEHKPSHSKFFPAYPEIKLNNKAVTTKNVKLYLLKNAFNCDTQLKKVYFLRNICSFDSIAQIVFTSAVDDPT